MLEATSCVGGNVWSSYGRGNPRFMFDSNYH